MKETKQKPDGKAARTISHLGFNCRDIKKSIAFYRDILGCEEKFTLTYNDMADDLTSKAVAAGKKPGLMIKAMRFMGKKTWLTYNDYRMAKSIEDSIDFAAKRHVWQRMIP